MGDAWRGSTFPTPFDDVIGVTIPNDDVKVETIRLRFSENRFPYVVSKPIHHSTSLKDNIEYMNRLVRFTNSNMSAEDFNLKQGDMTEFIRSYAYGWSNYGDNYFRLSIKNDVDCSCLAVFDKTMLTVMLDSILGNAARHGFHKRKNYTSDNEVENSLSIREYNGKPMP